MPFGKPRTDVRTALEEAAASGVQIQVRGAVLGSDFEETSYVKALAADRVVLGRRKEGAHGLPIMIGDIRTVALWEEPEDPRGPRPAPEPVGGPPPKSGSPGKREQVPPPHKTADAKSES